MIIAMLVSLAAKLAAISPRFRKLLWRRWYQYLAGYRIADWQFMNYGYAALDAGKQSLALDSAEEPDRHAIELYQRVAGAVELEGREVLEVGCGRGGGCSFIARYHLPRRITGVDFSAKAIRFCRQQHRAEGLSFVHGDAEALPFGDASFDAVVNVESSHCYASMAAFLLETRRVLRPGGYLLFADLRSSDALERLRREMTQAGFVIREEEDITPNVLAALRKDSARRLALIERSVSPRLVGSFKEFAAIAGSGVFEEFSSGKLGYLRYTLQKPQSARFAA
jgi:ubiquinone/menaquinone biosynthesis C-methylase UbiE